ncbi:hypothetical protein [Streptococcus troglodytae]|nr:hypothetical protein [Streptococcus troglodytae]
MENGITILEELEHFIDKVVELADPLITMFLRENLKQYLQLQEK